MKPLNLIEIKYCIQNSTVTILARNWIEPSDRWEEGWKWKGACNKDGDIQSLFQNKREAIIWCTKNLIFPHPMGMQLCNEFTYVTLRCVIPVVCVTCWEGEGSSKQHN